MRKQLRAPVFVVIAVGFVFLIAFYVSNNQLLLINFLLFLILAQGLNIQYGFTGYMPFGYGGFFGVGAYGSSIAILTLHWPPLLAVCLGGLAGVILAGILIPLLRLQGAYFAIASLAAAQIVFEVVANPALESVTGGPYGLTLSAVYAPNISYWVMLGILLLAIVIAAYLRLSRYGLALKAIRDNPDSAAMSGVNVLLGRVVSSLLSALIAGLAGGAYAWSISVFYPETIFSIFISVFAVLFTLFGGAGTVLGPLVGTGILYSLYNYIGITDPGYFQLIYGVLIAVLVLFLPGGLVMLAQKRGVNVF